MNDLDQLENRPTEYESGESITIEEKYGAEIFRDTEVLEDRDTSKLFEDNEVEQNDVSILFTNEMTYGFEDSNEVSTGSIVIYLIATVLLCALFYNLYNLIEKRKNAKKY